MTRATFSLQLRGGRGVWINNICVYKVSAVNAIKELFSILFNVGMALHRHLGQLNDKLRTGICILICHFDRHILFQEKGGWTLNVVYRLANSCLIPWIGPLSGDWVGGQFGVRQVGLMTMLRVA